MVKKFIIFLLLAIISSFLISGCLKPETSEPIKTEEEAVEEEKDEEMEEEAYKSGIPEPTTKQKCLSAAQEEIEDNPSYEKVIYQNPFPEDDVKKIEDKRNTYKCTVEFKALDTDKEKQGRFVWKFTVKYDPGNDKCIIQSSKKHSETYK